MGVFRNLFGSTRPARSARPRTFRPAVEALDQRLVLSTASASLHAVKGGQVWFDETDTFYINQQNGCLYEQASYKYGSWYWTSANQLTGANAVQTLSAGRDAFGNADVFAKFWDGSLQYWDALNPGWHSISGPTAITGGSIPSFAAVNGGRVYFTNDSGYLWEYTIGAPWYSAYTLITGPGAAQSIDAVTDSTGRDAIFALDNRGNFGEYYGTPSSGYAYTRLVSARYNYYNIPGLGNFSFYSYGIQPGFSAGLDKSGMADVYALDNYGSFWEYDTYSGLRYVAPSSAVQGQITATTNETVYVEDWNGNVAKYIGTTYQGTPVAGTGPFAMSAASDADVCFAVYVGYRVNAYWEFHNNNWDFMFVE